MKFKPTSFTILKREAKTSNFWAVLRGGKKTLLNGLYQGWINAYRAIDDKDRVVKIEIRIFRQK